MPLSAEPSYETRYVEAFRFFDWRGVDAIRMGELDHLLQSLRLGLPKPALERLVTPTTAAGKRFRVIEYLPICQQ